MKANYSNNHREDEFKNNNTMKRTNSALNISNDQAKTNIEKSIGNNKKAKEKNEINQDKEKNKAFNNMLNFNYSLENKNELLKEDYLKYDKSSDETCHIRNPSDLYSKSNDYLISSVNNNYNSGICNNISSYLEKHKDNFNNTQKLVNTVDRSTTRATAVSTYIGDDIDREKRERSERSNKRVVSPENSRQRRLIEMNFSYNNKNILNNNTDNNKNITNNNYNNSNKNNDNILIKQQQSISLNSRPEINYLEDLSSSIGNDNIKDNINNPLVFSTRRSHNINQIVTPLINNRLKNYEESLLSIKQSRILELELMNKELQEKVIYLESNLKQALAINSKQQYSSQDELKSLYAQLEHKETEIDFYYKENNELREELSQMKSKADTFSEIIHNLKTSFDQKINEIEDFTVNQEQRFKLNETNLVREINLVKEEKNNSISELIIKHEKEIEKILLMNKETKDKLVKMNMEKDTEYVKLMNEFKDAEKRLSDIIKRQTSEIDTLNVKLAEGK